jgi:erythromycin esterase-like protein
MRRILGILLGLIAGFAASTPPNASAAGAIADSQDAEVRSQLSSAVWPLRTAIPDGNLDDLKPLGDAIGTARIVGMGEATHGTSEFFSIKDRVLRFLVERRGFTVFAMEMPWTNGIAIDDYITGGKGNSRTLLASTFPVWDNQEVADLIEWMRSYNAAPGAHPTLRFVGIDMQDDPAALTSIIATYLDTADPAKSSAVVKALSCLQAGVAAPKCAKAAASVVALLATLPKPLTAEAMKRLLIARHAATTATQIAEMKSGDDAARDRSMADNVEWVANVLFPEARIALWGHDAHVMATANGPLTTMGTYLRAALGSSYYVVGFAFDAGTVSPNGLGEPITIAPAPATAIESELRAVGLALFGLNLRSISTTSPLGVYLSSPKSMRMLGSIDTPAEATDKHTLTTVDIKSAFDTLIFVERSHAAASFRVLAAEPPSAQSPLIQTPQSSGDLELTGQQILDKAVDVWENQPVPAYEAFVLPCHELLRKGAEGTCGSSTQMRVYLRTSDGMALVETIPLDGNKPTVLELQGHIYGPAYAPLGFTRKIGASQRVGSLAADPMAPLKTIAAVTATNTIYNVTVIADICNGVPAYHLTLIPRVQAATHPLRALWILSDSFKVCRLTYAIPFNGGEATVRYAFEDRGDPPIPSIVRISARVPFRSPIGVRYTDSTEDVQDITFPAQVPLP